MRKRKARDVSLLHAAYDGREHIGYYQDRGPDGIEVYDIHGVSVGLFPDQRSAAAALPSRDAS
jgi:hypothetical protein